MEMHGHIRNHQDDQGNQFPSLSHCHVEPLTNIYQIFSSSMIGYFLFAAKYTFIWKCMSHFVEAHTNPGGGASEGGADCLVRSGAESRHRPWQ